MIDIIIADVTNFSQNICDITFATFTPPMHLYDKPHPRYVSLVHVYARYDGQLTASNPVAFRLV